MKVGDQHYRSIWLNDDGWSIDVIDQTRLPHRFDIKNLRSLEQACDAIREMVVRGAPLIGATAAFGLYLALREDSSDHSLRQARERLLATRPTAVNLRWALERVAESITALKPSERAERALAVSLEICERDIETNRAIARHGVGLIRAIADNKANGEPVNILTHCNAGWLATVDWGTATAPIYLAQQQAIEIHVWVDETRPRNQGARLTAWELSQQGVPNTLIVDNAGGHLMQHGQVDLCLVGSDRTTRSGDVCNKIGTYLKALAASDNNLPFYVCLPSSTIDWRIGSGIDEIPIEQRDDAEVSLVAGENAAGGLDEVSIVADGTAVANYAFDVTPARYVTGLITEAGIIEARADALAAAFPEQS